jgi:uncharacterized protein YutE (UPF0331/DUF86 family)
MKRDEQYRRKLEFILDKITNLPEKVEDNEFLTDALFYRLQNSIDAAMDIIAMLCKDSGITVKDDYTNIEELNELNLLPPKLLTELRKLNSLRNLLVHRNNKIEEELIFQEKKNVVKTLKNFIKKVEVVVNEKIKISE